MALGRQGAQERRGDEGEQGEGRRTHPPSISGTKSSGQKYMEEGAWRLEAYKHLTSSLLNQAPFYRDMSLRSNVLSISRA